MQFEDLNLSTDVTKIVMIKFVLGFVTDIL